MENLQEFTFIIFTENQPGLLGRIAAVLARLNLSIDDMHTHASEVPGVYQYNIRLHSSLEKAERAKAQLHKLVEVLKVFMSEEDHDCSEELRRFLADTRLHQ
jgi:acetolactate synthase-1/3 small subunit